MFPAVTEQHIFCLAIDPPHLASSNNRGALMILTWNTTKYWQ
jgi:hypothetical protein